MKVTGFGLREVLRRWNYKRDAADNRFVGTLRVFEDDKKPHPTKVMDAFQNADRMIAKVQVAQDMYNLSVQITANGVTMTLAEAVNIIGGAGRTEKMWRSAATPKVDRYDRTIDDVRKSDEIRAKPLMTTEQLIEMADLAAAYASNLRFAIAQGNNKEMEIDLEGLEAAMLA